MQIGSPLSDGIQETLRCATTLSILMCDLIETDSLLLLSIEIIIQRQTVLRTSLNKGVRQDVFMSKVRNIQLAAHTMVFIRTPFLVLRALKKRKNLVVAPTFVPE
eukprot:Colp12_sorted_trinity150504_noHs@32097